MSRRHHRAAQRVAARESESVQSSAQASVQGPAQVIGTAVGTSFFRPAYQAAGLDSQDTVNWWPTRSSADALTLAAKDLSLARVRDVLRNDPNARAAIERLVDLIVGPGLHLSAKPDGDALGIDDPEVLSQFAKDLQREFRLFANDPRKLCDVRRQVSMNGIWRLFARTSITAGEATGVLSWRDAKAGQYQRYSTCVMTLDPDRLCNPNGMYETITLRGGVHMDEFGAPVGYWIRNAHPGDWWAAEEAWQWTYVPKETAWGRPVFIHAFEPEREGQTRAISPFAALLTRLRMIGKFGDAELASAAANALLAAFVETDLPVEEVATRMSPSAPMYADKVIEHLTKHPPHLGGVRIPVMPPGSKITMNNAPRQTSSFAAFQTAFLQSIAAALGLSYEQLSMDWSRTNYSSARAALNEVWRSICRLRAVFVEQVVTPIYYAVIEEAFDKGYLTLPPSAKPVGVSMSANDNLAIFHALPGAILRAKWIGPGRGFIDPTKEAQAVSLRLESLISTLEKECAEQGDNFEEVLDQIALEEQALKDRHLTRLSLVAAAQAAKGARPDSEEATGPAGPGGEDTQNRAA